MLHPCEGNTHVFPLSTETRGCFGPITGRDWQENVSKPNISFCHRTAPSRLWSKQAESCPILTTTFCSLISSMFQGNICRLVIFTAGGVEHNYFHWQPRQFIRKNLCTANCHSNSFCQYSPYCCQESNIDVDMASPGLKPDSEETSSLTELLTGQ